jgi:hypothetical protein
MNTSELKPLKVRIPSWVPDMDVLAANNGLVPDRLRAVLHQFFLSYIKDKRIRRMKDHEDENRLPGYFAVNAELLKEKGSENYSTYVRVLEDCGVIERRRSAQGKSSYLTGRHSTLFRWGIPEADITQYAFRHEEIRDRRTVKSVLASRDRHSKSEVRIKNDIEPAWHPVYEQLRQYATQVVFMSGHEEETSLDTDDLFAAEVMAGSISWHTVCEFGNRYHNQYTSLPKKYRRLMRFEGREATPLMMLDFANSQPYFSSILGCGTLIEDLLPEFKPVLPIFRRAESRYDYQYYRHLCTTGNLYKNFLGNELMSKEDVKNKLFRAILFARKRITTEDRLFRSQFKLFFPSVVKMADDIRKMTEKDLPLIKNIIRPTGIKFKYPKSNYSHKIIPCMMQRAESRIVYGHIVPEMIAAGIGPLLTIHDSFIILPEHEQKARTIIDSVFWKFQLPPPCVRSEMM